MIVYGDNPEAITGFGRVSHNILRHAQKYDWLDIAYYAVNRYEDDFGSAFDKPKLDFKIIRAFHEMRETADSLERTYKDPRGRQRFVDWIKTTDFDILMYVGDLFNVNPIPNPWIMETIEWCRTNGKNIKTLSYFPFEFGPEKVWLDYIQQTTYPVTFTRDGMEEIFKAGIHNKVSYQPLGVNTQVFDSGKDTSRFFETTKIPLDSWIVSNVNRNQPRKDVETTIKAFSIFVKSVKTDSMLRPVLYLHMAQSGEFGTDVLRLGRECGLKPGENLFIAPHPFSENHGVDEEFVAQAYNASAITVSTAVSEGYGLTPIEALCCGTPILIPDHTGFTDIIAYLPGYRSLGLLPEELIPTVSPKPLRRVDPLDLANRLVELYSNREKYDRWYLSFPWGQIRDTYDESKQFDVFWSKVFFGLKQEVEGIEDRRKINEGRMLYCTDETAGDVLLSLGAVAAIAEANPAFKIDFMTKPTYRGIAEGVKFIDKIIDYDPSKFYEYNRTFFPHQKIKNGNWAVGKTHLKDLYAMSCGVKWRQFEWITEPVPTLIPQVPYITVHNEPGRGLSRKWDRFAEFIEKHLSHLDGYEIVQIGDKNDELLPGVKDLRGLTWRQSGYVIQKAALHVGIDSFPMHVAAIVNTPSVAIAGGTNSAVWHPYRNGTVIEPNYAKDCPLMGPCYERLPCGIGHKCINTLPFEAVMRTIVESLMKTATTQPIKEVYCERNQEHQRPTLQGTVGVRNVDQRDNAVGESHWVN